MTLTEDDLRRRLARLAEHSQTTPERSASTLRQHEARRRPTLMMSIAAVAAVALVATIVVVRGDNASNTVRVGGGASTQSVGWTALPPVPIRLRVDAASVWTGGEWLLWGGTSAGDQNFGDGAAYVPPTGRWQLLPAAPIAGTSGPTSAWTGSEWLVIGGTDASGDAVTTGASFDPATRSWRTLAPAPFAPGFDAPSVWTGHELIVLSGLDQTASHAESFDPTRNSWTVLPSPPGASTAPSPSVAWTGTEFAVLRSTLPSSTVTPVPSSPAGQEGSPPSTVVTTEPPVPDSGLFVAVYDPGDEQWSRLPDAALADGTIPTLEWTGTELLALDPGHRSFAYQLVGSLWQLRRLSSSEDLSGVTISGPPAWTGTRAIYWGGGKTGLIYDAGANAWTTFPAGNLPTRQDPLLAWTGSRLLAWGGLVNSTSASAATAAMCTGLSG